MSNLASQLSSRNALDRLDEIVDEIPRVREDLGFIPLVTPTSQIVVSQATFNVGPLQDNRKSYGKPVEGNVVRRLLQ